MTILRRLLEMTFPLMTLISCSMKEVIQATLERILEECFLARLLRPDTQSCCRTAVNQFTHWHNVLPTEVVPHMVLERRHYLLNVYGIKPVNWNHCTRHMRVLYNFAIEQGLLEQLIGPFQKTSLWEPRKKKKTLTREQVLTSRKALNQFIEREKVQHGHRSPLHPVWFQLIVVETFNYTTIQLNQSIHLRVRGISLVHDTLLTQSESSESHDEYVVPITSRLQPYLEQMPEEAKTRGIRADNQLSSINRFNRRTPRQGKPMMENQVGYFFAKLSDTCHSRFSSHRHRHTAATELIQEPG